MEGGASASKTFYSKHDRKSLLDVRARYDGLQVLMSQLSNKLSCVSTQIEGDFLSAYRVHMLSIQTELRDLKMQVSKAEEALNDDKQVAQLEHEVSWFSEETTRLQNHATSMQKDMSHIVSRIEALREQRLFLSEQLKSTLKRSRILESELDLLRRKGSQGQGMEASLMETSASMPNLPKYSGKEQQKRLLTAASESKLPNILGQPKKTKKKSTSDVSLIPDDVLIQKRRGENTGTFPSAVEELRLLEEARFSTEVDLEESIRSVLGEIVERKIASVARVAGKSTSVPSEDNHRAILNETGGLTGLGLEHFADSDRLSAMASFMAKPEHFRRICEVIQMELAL